MRMDEANIGEGPPLTQKREENITKVDLEILEYLRQYGRTRKADIEKILNVAKSTVDHHLNKLEDYGRIHRIEHDQIEKKTVYYDLTPTELGKKEPQTSEVNVFNITPKEKHQVGEEYYDLDPVQAAALGALRLKIRALKRGDALERAKANSLEVWVNNQERLSRRVRKYVP